MEVYVVTCGDYSDYGIEAIFSTSAKAERFIETSGLAEHGKLSVEIEEWEVDQMDNMKIGPLWSCMIHCEDGVLIRHNCRKDALVPNPRYSQIDEPRSAWTGGWIIDVVSAVSQEHADKLAIEARQKWLRNGGAK